MLTLLVAALLSPGDAPPSLDNPTVFVPNRGQFDARVRYQAAIPGGDAFLTDRGLTVDLHNETKGHSFTLSFGSKGSLSPQQKAVEERNYFIGDEDTWATHVPTYGRIIRRDIAPGVDIVHYFDEGNLRYDLNVAPGADVSAIRMKISGAKSSVSSDGKSVVLDTVLGKVKLKELYAYQGEKAVPCGFKPQANGTLGFWVGSYDRTRPLIIDPIVWSRYIAGPDNDEPTRVVQKGTDIYTASNVTDNPFPDSDGGYQVVNNGNWDVVLSKHSITGVRSASTYFGGGYYDIVQGLAIDPQGDLRIVGMTRSDNIPTRKGSFQRRALGYNDVFVATISGDLSELIGSTYLGGSSDDDARDCVVDAAGNTVFIGSTGSVNALVTNNAVQLSKNDNTDAYFCRVTKDGKKLVYGTYFGGGYWEEPRSLAQTPDGSIVITGTTGSDNFPTTATSIQPIDSANAYNSGFIVLFKSTNKVGFSTYFNTDDDTWLNDVDINPAGEIAATGTTQGKSPVFTGAFKTPAGAEDAFVIKLSGDGKKLLGASMLGGAAYDEAFHVAFDAGGGINLAGETRSDNLPTVAAGRESDFLTRASTDMATMLARFSPDLKLARYVSYYSGNSDVYPKALIPQTDGTWIVGGWTTASNLPVIPAGNSVRVSGSDGWLLRISPGTVIKSVTASDVRSKGSSTVKITLNKKAVEDITLKLSDGSDLTDLTTKNLVIKKGGTSVETKIKAGTVSDTTRVTLTANYGASTVTGTVRIDP